MKVVFWPMVRVTLISSCLFASVCGYSIWRCSSPFSTWPIFGDYTVHCEWNSGIEKIEVFETGTKQESSNPITRVVLRRLATPVALVAIGHIHSSVATVEIDARAYGNLFPCKMTRYGWVKIIRPKEGPLPMGEVRID